MDLQSLVRTIPDYPKKGIMFRDITTLLKDTTGFNIAITRLKERYCNYQIDKVVGIESRGFIVGAALAHALGKGFVPVRKVGKLPGNKITQTYQLEYGTDTIEMHTDSLQPKERVLLVDDLLATGGTVLGAIQLIEKLGGVVEEACFIIDLPDLNGGKKLKKNGYKYFSLIEFVGE